VRNADIFSLRAINQVPQNPSAVFAVSIHLLFAILTFSARSNARDQYMVALFKIADCGPDFLDNAHAFVAKDPAISYLGHIAF
jgi:hypothetical protein